jgi:hypothetical protein
MDAFHDVSGPEWLQLAFTRGAPAHIAGRDRALLAQEHGTAGKRCFVLLMSDFESGYDSKSRWQCSLLGSRSPIDLSKV